MDELDQLFKDILAARHEGATTAQINAALAENPKWGGRFQSEADVRQALTQRDLAAQAAQEGSGVGAAQAAVRGYTSGLSDEIAGLGDAVLAGMQTGRNPDGSFRGGFDAARQAYTGTRDAVRATQRQYATAHPTMSAVTQVVGSLIPAIATSGLLKPATSFGGLAVQGAKIGAAQGAASGFGEGEGLEGSLRGAAIDAPLGALVGGAAGPLTKLGALGAGAIYRGGRAVLAPTLDAEASRAALLGRFLTPEAVARFRRLQAVRPNEAMVADANPPLLDVVANKSTAAGDAADAMLQARNAREGGLLAGQLEDAAGGARAISAGRRVPGAQALAGRLEDAATGRVPGRPGPGIDAIGAEVTQPQLKTLRARLFDPLETQYPVTPETPEGQALHNLLGTDEDVGRVFAQVVPRVEQRAARGTMQQYQLTPGFRSWQSTLHRLEDDAGKLFRNGEENQAIKLSRAAQRLETAMEDAFPGFREANASYRIPKEIMEAQGLGRLAASRDPREIARDLARWNPNPQTGYVGNPDAQSAYRMAALDPVVARLRGLAPNANAFRRAIQQGDQDLTPRLQALFPDPADLNTYLRDVAVTRAGFAGKTALNKSAEQITSDLAELAGNPRAQTAYRMNALHRAIAGLRGIRPEANAFREALVSGNQDLTPRLQALFPNPSDLDEFLANAEVARSFRQTLTARAGSKTQGRAALESEIFKSPGLGVGSALNRMGRLFQNFGLEGRDARIADAVAPDIFASGQAAEPVIARAEAARAAQAFRDRLAGRAGNVASSVTGRFPQESALLSVLALSRLPWLRGSAPRTGQ